MIALQCEECGAKITVDEEAQIVKFHGNPSICLCRVSDEDIEKHGLNKEDYILG